MKNEDRFAHLDDGDLVGQLLSYDIYDKDDPAEVEKFCRLKGIHWTLALVIDININLNTPVNTRTASDSGKKVSKIWSGVPRCSEGNHGNRRRTDQENWWQPLSVTPTSCMIFRS